MSSTETTEVDVPERASGEVLVRPSRVLLYTAWVCVGFELFLLILDYQVNYGRWTEIGAVRRLANIAREDGLASWFGMVQLLMISVTVWAIYFVVRARGASRWCRRGWAILACFFSYMTVDDGAELHERSGTVFGFIKRAGGSDGLLARLIDLFPSYYWLVIALPFFGVAGLFMLFFLWRQLKEKHSALILVLAVSCFVFAVGLDFIEGLDEEHAWNLYTHITERWDISEFTQARFKKKPHQTLVHFSKATEEFLEMLGYTLLWLLMLRHGMAVAADVRLRFVRDADA